MEYINYFESPLGRLTLTSDGEALTGVWFEKQKYYGATMGEEQTEKDLPVFEETKRWLDLYFQGVDPGPIPKVSMKGSEFRQMVWEILREIPYGETSTYGEIARKIALRKGISRMSAQAVGGAVGHNPIGILVPCHRVLGADGSLTGYAGGIEKKEALLKIEGITFRTN